MMIKPRCFSKLSALAIAAIVTRSTLAQSSTCPSGLKSLQFAAPNACTQNVWTSADIVAQESVGAGVTGNQVGTCRRGVGPHDDPIRQLTFNVPSYTVNGGYWVRVEWGGSSGASCSHITFYVPYGSNIFARAVNRDITLENVSYSDMGVSRTPFLTNGRARFCHACTGDTASYRPGDTCWAILPGNQNTRGMGCGCNGGGWAGNGVYYGGFPHGYASACCGHAGGFAGAKLNGQQKGGLYSVGMTMYVRPVCAPPTPAPTRSPTELPTASPTFAPTATPTGVPTRTCRGTPDHPDCRLVVDNCITHPFARSCPALCRQYCTESPSATPTAPPTLLTAAPSGAPSSASPTVFPTQSPTATPTESPTGVPTDIPSMVPTETPSTTTISPTASSQASSGTDGLSSSANGFSSALVLVVFAIMIAIIAALAFIVKRKSVSANESQRGAFDNPMYDQANENRSGTSFVYDENAPDNDGFDSNGGYMDINADLNEKEFDDINSEKEFDDINSEM